MNSAVITHCKYVQNKVLMRSFPVSVVVNYSFLFSYWTEECTSNTKLATWPGFREDQHKKMEFNREQGEKQSSQTGNISQQILRIRVY